MVTAFGGGTIYYVLLCLTQLWNDPLHFDLRAAFAWGKLAWQQPLCVTAAVAGFLLAARSYTDSNSQDSQDWFGLSDKQFFSVADSVNMGELRRA